MAGLLWQTQSGELALLALAVTSTSCFPHPEDEPLCLSRVSWGVPSPRLMAHENQAVKWIEAEVYCPCWEECQLTQLLQNLQEDVS